MFKDYEWELLEPSLIKNVIKQFLQLKLDQKVKNLFNQPNFFDQALQLSGFRSNVPFPLLPSITTQHHINLEQYH